MYDVKCRVKHKNMRENGHSLVENGHEGFDERTRVVINRNGNNTRNSAGLIVYEQFLCQVG